MSRDPLVPLLIPLDEDRDPGVLLLLCLLLLVHEPARVLLQLTSNSAAQLLSILAVTRVVRHIAVLASAVLERFRLVGSLIATRLDAILVRLLKFLAAADVA